jgi:phage/conjugal plasmid C-4 type zinc finger TraR family protein
LDVTDRASEAEALDRAQALAANKPVIEKPVEFHGHRYCKDCSCELTTERLFAVPTAVRCVGCQTFNEHTAKQFRSR